MPSSNSAIAAFTASSSAFRYFFTAPFSCALPQFSYSSSSSTQRVSAKPASCWSSLNVPREVANGVVGSSQPVAPLLSDQLIGVAKAHAEHRLNLVAECRHDRVVRTATCQPRLALRRCCLLALVASTHGAVRVLEQAVSAAVGAVALRVGVRGMWTRTRVFLGWVYLDFCGYTRVLPASCSRTCI